ncbi:MAG: hypothetical protein ACLFR1_11215 [Spirochaetia bacterium]
MNTSKFDRFYRFILSKAHKKNIILLILLVIACEVLFMAWLTPLFSEVTGGETILDMRFTLFFPYLDEIMDSIGVEGINVYSIIQIVDFIFPLAYGLALSLGLTALFSGKPQNKSIPVILISLIPIIGMFFDYLENISIFILLRLYPSVPYFLGIVINIFLIGKYLFLGISLLLIPIGFIYRYLLPKKLST